MFGHCFPVCHIIPGHLGPSPANGPGQQSRRKEYLVKQATTTTLQGCCLFQWTFRPSPQQLYNDNNTIYFHPSPLPVCFQRKQVMIFDEHNDKQIVGLFKFIPFSSMTRDELNDLDFLTEFSHDHKSFINSFSNFHSACLGGKMNMLGWQKCMKKDEQFGLYLSVEKISKYIDRFTSVVQRGHQSGLIIGKSFKKLANNTFQKDHNIMVEHKMPDFGDPKIHTSEGHNFSAASLVSYMYDGFYNTPQKDKRDASEFAFFQCISTFSKTGKGSTHRASMSRVVSLYSMIASLDWDMSRVQGCYGMQLSIATSLPLKTKTFNVFNNINTQPACYDVLHDGDLDHIVNTVEQHKNKKK
ncbi:hypothetical protein VP01_4092g1 [Puccinia sorghi]|uniref:Tet-like 2OG-Fe(II) oxygenase domain-containing protein n=1 Tax=Puccinia sorghi TaxID=27349 RepID=A0A0L6UTB3_9BASI|nr:hypothetical protein VP01_4092g1 [Puccinia sorghi]